MPNVRKEATITSKGQITIPIDIRRLLGVQAGEVFETAGEEVSVRPVGTPGSFEKYRGTEGNALPGVDGRAGSQRGVAQRVLRGDRGRRRMADDGERVARSGTVVPINRAGFPALKLLTC